MNKFNLIPLLKGTLLAGLLLAISLSLKLFFTYSYKSESRLKTKSLTEGDKHIFYFIGSSRVQRSISPDLLKTNLPNYSFINLGLSSSSFLYNCKVASNLLKNESEKKVLFIELTRLNISPSDSYYFLMTFNDVWAVVKQHLAIRCTQDEISRLLFYFFNIHSDIKKIVYPPLNLYVQNELGFVDGHNNYNGSTKSMLTPQSFSRTREVSPAILETYFRVINELTELARINGSEIIFILPLTIGNADEFNIDLTVFDRLPEKHKWTYSNRFLRAMNNTNYLIDANHLSSEGAHNYSLELSRYIQARFDVLSPK